VHGSDDCEMADSDVHLFGRESAYGTENRTIGGYSWERSIARVI
jgi:hypothetical protein